MFSSPTLPYSSCRTVGSAAPYSVGNVSPVNFMSSITMAPRCYTASEHSVLFRSRGAVSIHQLCFAHDHVSNRCRSFSGSGSGAAGFHALSGKARSLLHDQSNAPQPGPQVLCNKNRSGTYQLKARSLSARRVESHQQRDKRLGNSRYRRSK